MEYSELNDAQKIQVAKGFDASPELIPFIPYLLQDLFELGSSPKNIIQILKTLNIENDSTVLDLACGKGAVSIQISEQLGFICTGIDLFKPFIEIANQKAKERRLDRLCTFEVGDATKEVKSRKGFEVVILAAAESLLGDIEESIKLLRNTVNEKGYIIIDTSYLIEKLIPDNPDYSSLKSYNETIERLTSFGDKIISEVSIPKEEVVSINKKNTDSIRTRAGELSLKYPENKVLFESYVLKQEMECLIIENQLVGCTWCLQKNE